MLRMLCRAKLHGAVITESQLEYPGSITIDQNLMDAADILACERVQVVNLANGSRLETYVIAGAPGSGTICLNGPAAHRGNVGDRVHILSYATVDDKVARTDWSLKTVILGPGNRVQTVK